MGNCICMRTAEGANAPTPLESKVTRSSTTSNSTDTTFRASRGSTSSAFFSDGQLSRASDVPAASGVASLKSFSLSDLRAATKNFGSNSYLGEGGFGCVYKGWIDEVTLAPTKPGVGKMVAIKKLKKESFQGHREWLTEVTYLGQLHHENLVKLVGYCSDSDNKLLVYEYMIRGSLENHLFRRATQPLSWAMRVSIAVDVARGLAFLHDQGVIFRDLKSPNVLLDSDYRAKLSDFGLARSGPTGDKSHVSTRVVGTRGYAAPEYIATGHLSLKSDVYSFGVVLLELLTGRRALDEARASTAGAILADWARPLLSDRRKVIRIMDTRLGGRYPKKQAQELAALALRCLQNDSKNRPGMADDVLPALQQLQQSSKSSSSSSQSHTSTPVRTERGRSKS